MDIYIIADSNLSECVDAIVVAPIMGNTLTAKEYFELTRIWYNKSGKLCTPSEIGCAMTHLEIYKKIIEKNRSALIFEADIVPTLNQINSVREIVEKTQKDFIHLGWHPSVADNIFFKGKLDKATNLYEINPNIDFHGAYSYYITPKAAKMLIDFHNKALRPADSWAIFFNEFDITPYFYPIFTHPPHRGNMHSQRLNVSSAVFALTKENTFFYLKKLIIKILSRFKLYNSIKNK